MTQSENTFAAHEFVSEPDTRKSDRILSQIIQGSSVPTFIIDGAHRVIYWNQACENLTGLRTSDIIGTRYQWRAFYTSTRPVMADLIVDDVGEKGIAAQYPKKYRKSELMEGAYEAEDFFPHLGENGKWLFFTASPIRDAHGKITGAIETLQDITERKTAEKRLRQSETRLSQIIQGSAVPTFVIDKNHMITHWNKACGLLTGHPGEKMVGTAKQWQPFYFSKRPLMADLIVDGASDEIMARFYGGQYRKSLLIDGAYEAEDFIPYLGEGGRWIFFAASPLLDGEGHIIGAIETLQDMTERKQAELTLNENQVKLSQIIQGNSVPTFVIDDNHIITHWNKACENLTGLSAEDMIGTKKQWMAFYASDRPVLADLIVNQAPEEIITKHYGNKHRKSQLIEGAYEAEDFFPDLGRQGKRLFFTASPLRDPEGRITGAIETLQTIIDPGRLGHTAASCRKIIDAGENG